MGRLCMNEIWKLFFSVYITPLSLFDSFFFFFFTHCTFPVLSTAMKSSDHYVFKCFKLGVPT